MSQNKIEEINDLLKIMSTHNMLRSSLIAQKLRINTTDLECLEILLRIGKATAGTLGLETKLTTGAITKMIDRLEKAGFVERQFDESDRRKVYISLKKNVVMKKVFPLYEPLGKSVNKHLSKYTAKELDLLIDFLSNSIRLSDDDLKNLSNL